MVRALRNQCVVETTHDSGPAPEVGSASMRPFWPRELGARRPSASNCRALSAAEQYDRRASNFRFGLWRRASIRTRRHSSTRPAPKEMDDAERQIAPGADSIPKSSQAAW